MSDFEAEKLAIEYADTYGLRKSSRERKEAMMAYATAHRKQAEQITKLEERVRELEEYKRKTSYCGNCGAKVKPNGA